MKKYRVSNIPYEEKPSHTPTKEITCERCGIKFIVKGRGHGRTKYCIECKVIVYNERQRRKGRLQ